MRVIFKTTKKQAAITKGDEKALDVKSNVRRYSPKGTKAIGREQPNTGHQASLDERINIREWKPVTEYKRERTKRNG